MDNQEQANEQANEQAKSRPSPINGQIPPVEHQFKPGQSGNPQGRPKQVSITKMLRELLARDIRDGTTNADLFLDVGFKAAIGIKQKNSPDFKFWKEFLDRNDGKVTEPVDDGKDPGEMTTEAIEDELRKLEKGKTP